MHASTDGLVEPVETVETPMRNPTHSLRQHSSHVPSPLQQTQTYSSPRPSQDNTPTDGGQVRHNANDTSTRSSGTSSQSEDSGSPTLYLRGYFSPQGYTFAEELQPRTEPRLRTQPLHRARAVSSSSGTSLPYYAPTQYRNYGLAPLEESD
jgi:hypothetical protein